MTKFRKNKNGKTHPITPPQPKPPTLQDHLRHSIPSRNTIFEGAFAWYGCYTLPGQCLVIKAIAEVYKRYKQNQLNINDAVESLMHHEMSHFVSTVSEEEINKVSKEIIANVNMAGLIYKISKSTEVNENIIEGFMDGTVSNLLKDTIENGTGFLVKKVIL